jgi:GNAT superfamily N-acetyltransferase
MKEIHIRFALPEDIEDICHVQRAAVRAIEGEPYTPDIIEAWSVALTLKAVREEMKTPDMTWFVAELSGKVVGFSSIQKHEVSALYVHPDHQNKGIGSKLLARVEAEAIRHGIHRLTLFASMNSRQFYESHGYRVIREMLYPLNDGESMTTLSMEKELPG